MFLSRLVIEHFRNLEDIKLNFDLFRNHIFGDNAQGKTNIIEAIYLLCLAKSFRTREDADLVPFSNEEYFIEGEFKSELDIIHHIGISFDQVHGKQIKIDNKKLNQYSKLVGLFPVVILSVDDYSITIGPPAQRRRFFNILLSQCSTHYLDDLKQYEKVLKQRNKILNENTQGNNPALSQLDAWNTQLVRFGSKIIEQRNRIIKELNTYVGSFYKIISKKDKEFNISYRPNVKINAHNEIEKQFVVQLEKMSERERQQKKTLVGPHRDEFVFYIEREELRKFGSRGEHKSVLISLKAAEAKIIENRTDSRPILLLDDLYAELDKERSSNVLNLFAEKSQIFITGTTHDYTIFNSQANSHKEFKTFFVKSGKVKESKV